MMTDKRLGEMKDLVTYAEITHRESFAERKLRLALKDAIAEIEELKTARAEKEEIATLHSQMCRLSAERFEEINLLRARLGEPSIPSHYEE